MCTELCYGFCWKGAGRFHLRNKMITVCYPLSGLLLICKAIQTMKQVDSRNLGFHIKNLISNFSETAQLPGCLRKPVIICLFFWAFGKSVVSGAHNACMTQPQNRPQEGSSKRSTSGQFSLSAVQCVRARFLLHTMYGTSWGHGPEQVCESNPALAVQSR